MQHLTASQWTYIHSTIFGCTTDEGPLHISSVPSQNGSWGWLPDLTQWQAGLGKTPSLVGKQVNLVHFGWLSVLFLDMVILARTFWKTARKMANDHLLFLTLGKKTHKEPSYFYSTPSLPLLTLHDVSDSLRFLLFLLNLSSTLQQSKNGGHLPEGSILDIKGNTLPRSLLFPASSPGGQLWCWLHQFLEPKDARAHTHTHTMRWKNCCL